MKISSTFLSGLLLAALASPAFAGGHGAHWSYEGASGPEHWGELSPDYGACARGREQSPVDLRWRAPKGGRELELRYRSAPATIVDNGHTIQIDFEDGGSARIEGHEYRLVQMHFHSESEHTLSGKRFPLEAHLVHKDAAGRIAVVGVMIRAGSDHSAVAKTWAKLPETGGKTPAGELNPADFIPAPRTHYHYMGSLTTPPCSEGVNWNVLNTPIELSRAQIAEFRRRYPSNSRPVQPWRGRKPANFE